MPHGTAAPTAPRSVEFLKAALEYSDVQLQRAQSEIVQLRAAVASYRRLEIR